MKVVLIRHGQSTNSELAAALYADDIGSERELEQAWLSQREVDPQLTPQGKAEVAMLCQSFGREYLSSVLDLDEVTDGGSQPGNVTVALLASPMWRALQTAQPLCAALDIDLQVDSSLCDVGGHFAVVGWNENARAPSADEIVSAFSQSDNVLDNQHVTVDVTRLPATGPWDSGSGFESIGEARLRSKHVAESLCKTALTGAVDVLVLVTHDAFLKLLMTVLLSSSLAHPGGHWLDGSEDQAFDKGLLSCEILNTATTALELDCFDGAESARLLWLNRIDHFLLSARL